MKKKIGIGVLSIILLTLLDQITKYLAVLHLKNQSSIILIPGVFQLHYLENRGAAFGIFQGGKVVFIICTFIFILIAVYLGLIRIPSEKRFNWLRMIDILLIAGAIGNLIDRIINDYVVDFFYFNLINFPIFNVADIYVTCSCIALILLILFYYKEEDLNAIFSKNKSRNEK